MTGMAAPLCLAPIVSSRPQIISTASAKIITDAVEASSLISSAA